jgi:hypothetical protein
MAMHLPPQPDFLTLYGAESDEPHFGRVSG